METHARFWERRTAVSLTLLLRTFLTTALIQYTTLFIFPTTQQSISIDSLALDLHLYPRIRIISDAAFNRLGLNISNQETLQTPQPTNSKSHSHSSSLLCRGIRKKSKMNTINSIVCSAVFSTLSVDVVASPLANNSSTTIEQQ